MRIGIDARFYSESGVGRYLRNLIENLKILDSKNDYYIFLLPKDLKIFKENKNFHKIEADYNWYGFAEQFKFPKLLKTYQLDLMHFPHFNVPVFYSGKFVVTIHDLIHQHHQMKRSTTLNPFAFKIKQVGYKRVFKNAVSKSCKILVPSDSVMKLLKKEWMVDLSKVIKTYEAVDDEILSLNQKFEQLGSQKILNKFNIKPPYIFYIGNAHPHKNIEGLITAFDKLKSKYPDLSLVLSGADHYFWERIKKENKVSKVIFTGFVTDEELIILYKNADVFVMPSFEEGFGLPLLEAMALGCPVVASDSTSLPEIGSDAVLYFDPKSLTDMTEKISKVLSDEKLRKDLIGKGKVRVKDFSWRKMAKETLEVYQKCA